MSVEDIGVNIEDFLGEYSTQLENAQKNIFSLKEFNQLKLNRFEPEPTINYNNRLYFKYQILVQRFLSPYTLYDRLLVFHGLGTGKTRTSILVAELNKLPEKANPLILVRSDILMDNFVKELAQVNEEYIPLDKKGNKMRDETSLYYNRLKRKVKRHYEINTFGAFINNLGVMKKYSKEEKKQLLHDIEKKYSNRVIIVDEAHNLRKQEGKGDTKFIYDGMKIFFSTVKNCKILFLTGTPTWDNYAEITEMMNLISKHPIPTPIFKDNKLKNEKELIDSMRGQVSYIREEQADIKRIYKGQIIPPLKHTKVFPSEMSTEQYKATLKAKNEKDAYRRKEIAAAMFTYKDGTYDKKFFTKYIKESNKEYRFINSKIEEDVKKNLKTYSIKFYTVIKKIQKAQGPVFVYDKAVKGSGIILFSLILRAFGFVQSTSNTKAKKDRYVLISSDTTDDIQVRDLINEFNKPKNVNGDYIKVMIGSKKISEGITLKNIREIHILSPYWNFSGVDQAVGRGVRYNAHKDILKFLHKDTSSVDIYFHVGTYKDKITVDLSIYDKAEVKDIKNRAVYRALKKASIDCPLAYERNVSPLDENGSRECDYQECNYECSDVAPIKKGQIWSYHTDKISDTNYNIYYASNEIVELQQKIPLLFKVHDILSLEQIVSHYSTDEKLVQQALTNLIISHTPVYDRVGILSYIKRIDELYFLERTETDPKKIHSFYLNNIILKKDTTLTEMVEQAKIQEDMKIISKLCEKFSVERFEQLNHPTKVLLFELAYELNVVPIINYMRSFFYIVSNVDIIKRATSHYLKRIAKGIKDTDKEYETTIRFLAPTVSFDLAEDSVEVEKIKKISTEAIRELQYKKLVVHTLGEEPPKTGFKRVINPTGKTKYYDEKASVGRKWKVLPHNIEHLYTDEIKDIEKLTVQVSFINNPYGYAGLEDKNTKEFQILKEKGKGMVCTSYNKISLNKIVKDISAVRAKMHRMLKKGAINFLQTMKYVGKTGYENNPFGYYLIDDVIYDADLKQPTDQKEKEVEKYIEKILNKTELRQEGAICDNIREFLLKNQLLREV